MTHTIPSTPSIREHRALLQRMLERQPTSVRARRALQALMTPKHIALAAQQGIFVSYERPDELFALELSTDLRDLSGRIFMDALDVPADADWMGSIKQALDQCGVMLWIVSPAALKASHTTRERKSFLQAGKIILPIMPEPVKYAQPYRYTRGIAFYEDERQSLQTLVRILGIHSGAPAGA